MTGFCAMMALPGREASLRSRGIAFSPAPDGMRQKSLALIEVVAVFALTLLLVAVVSSSAVAAWVRRVTHRAFLEYAVMIAVPMLILILSRRNLSSYGVSLLNLRYHLDITLTAFLPMAIALFATTLVDYRYRDGAIVMAALQVALLLVLGLLLRRKPTAGNGSLAAAALFIGISANPTANPGFGKALSALLFYVFFLGFGEELLFRGYIQSRLNMAFGRPFAFYGVPWGWGALIASALFALMHAFNLGSLALGDWHPTPWWALWTFPGGLVLAFVREKTGSIVAPTLLHGLPQGIGYALVGL